MDRTHLLQVLRSELAIKHKIAHHKRELKNLQEKLKTLRKELKTL